MFRNMKKPKKRNLFGTVVVAIAILVAIYNIGSDIGILAFIN